MCCRWCPSPKSPAPTCAPKAMTHPPDPYKCGYKPSITSLESIAPAAGTLLRYRGGCNTRRFQHLATRPAGRCPAGCFIMKCGPTAHAPDQYAHDPPWPARPFGGIGYLVEQEVLSAPTERVPHRRGLIGSGGTGANGETFRCRCRGLRILQPAAQNAAPKRNGRHAALISYQGVGVFPSTTEDPRRLLLCYQSRSVQKGDLERVADPARRRGASCFDGS